MKILMLIGKSKCGKTTTIKKIYVHLVKESETIKFIKHENGEDFLCILTYKESKIGIYSMGDYSYEITDKIDFFEENECDIVVCACNNRFRKPRKKILEYAGSMLIEKTLSNAKITTKEANMIDANKIINTISYS